MILTREMDYAARIVRKLHENELVSATEMESMETVPTAFARKILRKLKLSGIVEVVRGAQGGYRLKVPCTELTLGSLIEALGEHVYVNECIQCGYECTSKHDGDCKIHQECVRIQQVLDEELNRRTFEEILQ